MRVLVEILHPAHVHFFRNAIKDWKAQGDEVLVLARDKDCCLKLLREYGIDAESTSKVRQGSWGLFFEWIQRCFFLWKKIRDFKPDVLTGIMGVTVSPVGKFLGIPSVVFYDTEIAKLTNSIAFSLADRVCVPASFQNPPAEAIRYLSYHELAYLHPQNFEADPQVLKELGVQENETFALLRFVSRKASHDRGTEFLNLQQRIELALKLAEKMKIFISSEIPLPSELEPFRFQLPLHRFHHALAYASVSIGESATISSEAAVLGVPAIFISDSSRGYTDEQEKRYGLVKRFAVKDWKKALNLATAIAFSNENKIEYSKRREDLLRQNKNTTDIILKEVGIATHPAAKKKQALSFR